MTKLIITPFEHRVLKEGLTSRWQTCQQIAQRVEMDSFAVAQALHYLHSAARVDRRVTRGTMTAFHWRKTR